LVGDPDPALADDAAVMLVRGHLEVSGPVTVADLCATSGLSPSSVNIALEVLRSRGFALTGRFEPDRSEQWCAESDQTADRRRRYKSDCPCHIELRGSNPDSVPTNP
jgi:hypothetical protein